ncbi:hypothetical protein CHARACLAT_020449 [Characodon lateralis]|uniref:Uncharacterized protein n=1 Tax=Characodon lateralis TaxID=208331 RepID=A0ABU7EPA2_9TELE|nr:hypothetical protein [Characodon lateralis]
MEDKVINNKFGLERFAASEDKIRCYTRFASYAHLMSFWSQIEPATHDMYVTRAQTVRPAVSTHWGRCRKTWLTNLRSTSPP